MATVLQESFSFVEYLKRDDQRETRSELIPKYFKNELDCFRNTEVREEFQDFCTNHINSVIANLEKDNSEDDSEDGELLDLDSVSNQIIYTKKDAISMFTLVFKKSTRISKKDLLKGMQMPNIPDLNRTPWIK